MIDLMSLLTNKESAEYLNVRKNQNQIDTAMYAMALNVLNSCYTSTASFRY